MSKRKDFLKGKGLSYWAGISPNEFYDLQKSGNEWKLRAVATAMASAVNKRLKAFRKAGIVTPATNYIEDKFGTRITTKDLSKNQLTSLYFELKGFYESETSTITGWNSIKKKVLDKMADEGIEITSVDYDDYWKAFDKIETMNKNRMKRKVPGASVFSRDVKYKVLEYVKEKLIQNPDRSANSIARSLFRKDKNGKTMLDKLYEEMEVERRAIEDRLSASRLL